VHPGDVGARNAGRREVLLCSVGMVPILAGMLVGTDDPTTIVNSILSGYGEGTLGDDLLGTSCNRRSQQHIAHTRHLYPIRRVAHAENQQRVQAVR
jgi:hypothetical protein